MVTIHFYKSAYVFCAGRDEICISKNGLWFLKIVNKNNTAKVYKGNGFEFLYDAKKQFSEITDDDVNVLIDYESRT